MNPTPLLRKDIQDYINKQLQADCSKLALQKNPFPEVPWLDIIQQIQSKQKCFGKLPTWYQTTNLIYPVKLSIEQSSSELTAQYKSTLINGNTLLDLTGGMGVDAYYFAKRFNHVTHCELSAALSASVQHNFSEFGLEQVDFVVGDSLNYLQQTNRQYDCIYVDPSRRNEAKGKVFLLEDCLPNVPEHLSELFAYTSTILVKTAPILDLSSGLKSLQNVQQIHIVAVDNEVKELLWLLQKDSDCLPTIHCVNLTKNDSTPVVFEWNSAETCAFSLPKNYLFEPNSAIMKSGKFAAVANKFGLSKLHEHSHLYTHDSILPFPGRIFTIEICLPYSKQTMQKLGLTKANISTRNFPDSVEEIRKKWKIKDGGSSYCFFTTDLNNQKIVLLCSKQNLTP